MHPAKETASDNKKILKAFIILANYFLRYKNNPKDYIIILNLYLLPTQFHLNHHSHITDTRQKVLL